MIFPRSPNIVVNQTALLLWGSQSNSPRRGICEPLVNLVDALKALAGARTPLSLPDGPPGCQLPTHRHVPWIRFTALSSPSASG